jgi:septal ring factor EnvC (AmiA/AmiB activator)
LLTEALQRASVPRGIANAQVDEGNLTRLQEAAAQKASRLQGQQQQLEQLQQRLGGLQEELGQLERQLAAKKEEAKAAQAEHRKSRCGKRPAWVWFLL